MFHVELRPHRHGVLVRDMESKNGVFVNGVQIHSAVVPPSTVLILGKARVMVQPAEEFVLSLSKASSFGGLVGSSQAMRQMYTALERLAPLDLTVLLLGETGTGKELAARALHTAGRRSSKPFVVLDATTIPASLAASTLFGHEKGAFTGANESRIGVFEAANGGTLFIDEVGELPLELQPLLLRVLQERQVVPVGSTKPRKIDVRIVCATWRDLRTMVNRGIFRGDLYHRLAQSVVHLPSLEERREDISLIVHHFLANIPIEERAARAITQESIEALGIRAFPGNIRELRNTVELLARIANGPTITMEDLAIERRFAAERCADVPVARGFSDDSLPEMVPLEMFKEAKRTSLDEFEKAYLVNLLQRIGNNLSKAAAVSGLERHSLRELLRKHGLYHTK